MTDLSEVKNYLTWRSQDAYRNSVAMVAQSLYSHKELHKVSVSKQQELIFQKGINWNDYPSRLKRGGTFVRTIQENSSAWCDVETPRNWFSDVNQFKETSFEIIEGV